MGEAKLLAWSVIYASEMPDFEDGLGMGTIVEVITDGHSIRTNPEVSVRLIVRCGRFTTVRRGHKTQSLQLFGSVPFQEHGPKSYPCRVLRNPWYLLTTVVVLLG